MKTVFSHSMVRGGINRFHIFHLLAPSIWPLLVSGAVFNIVITFISLFFVGGENDLHRGGLGYLFVDPSMFISVLVLIYVAFCWWSDVSHESGEHTAYTVRGLKLGMALFIISEVMFFFSFFWAFFHFSLSPAEEVGGIWPPLGLEGVVLSYKKVPLLNTLLLLSSGVSITYAHAAFHGYFYYWREIYTPLYNSHGELVQPAPSEGDSTVVTEGLSTNAALAAILAKYGFPRKGGTPSTARKSLPSFALFFTRLLRVRYRAARFFYNALEAMVVTLAFAFGFVFLQFTEYLEAAFSISDGVYGSTFFVMTGFHGLHVLIGAAFLVVCFYRIIYMEQVRRQSTGLECAIWYWHFVDVVWLFLFVSVYWWGGDFIAAPAGPATGGDDVLGSGGAEGYFPLSVQADCVYDPDHPTIGFQDPATIFMEEIISMYNYICLYLVFIFFILLFLILDILE